MILKEWIISLPVDIVGYSSDHKELLEYAIYYVREEITTDYVIPAVWDAWVAGAENALGEIPLSVTRLSNGGES